MKKRSLKVLLFLFIFLCLFSFLLCFVVPGAAICVAICIFGIIGTARDLIILRKISKLPVLAAYAKVISKHTKVVGSHLAINSTQYITFELTNGVRKMFKVSLQQFGTIIETDQGVLSYKELGKRIEFVDFQIIKDMPGHTLCTARIE